MKNKFLISSLVSFLLLGFEVNSPAPARAAAISFAVPKTLVLYDSASGTIPSAPLMGFLGFPQDGALLFYADGAAVLDTTIAGSDTYAGWVASGAASPGFPFLDQTAGFQIHFILQVENESHIRDNRAGFSIIVLGGDTKGIELAFWEHEIWAQSDEATGGLFRRGEGAAFDTTVGPVEYQVSITDNTYTLTANHEPLLSGPVRDYTAFDGFPDPYETPNFLFLGDNTTSAQARVRLSFVSITGSEPSTPAVTGTGPNPGTPIPTEPSAPFPSATKVASPAPSDGISSFCPSTWLLSTMTMTVVVLHGRSRRVRWRHLPQNRE